MARRTAAVARVIPAAPAADPEPDTISDSGSSTSVPPSPPPPQQPGRNSVLQVVRAGAPVIPTPENGKKPVAVEEMRSQVVEGSAHAVVAATTTINRYLRTHGRIPMTRPKGRPDLDLNALAPPDGSQPPPQVDRPVICAYCNCAFCFAAHEVPSLYPGPRHVYPAPSVPITLNLLTPPAVGPLYRDRDAPAPGATPEWLPVCSREHHFKVTMGLLQQQQPGAAPSLVWKRTISCLNVQPIVVGSEGASSSDPHANPEPYSSYVVRGDEDMLKLKLHDDPLKLTLGRR